MGRILYSKKIKSVEQIDSYLNTRGLMFGFRTEEFTLAPGTSHYISFDVPAKKKVQFHHRAIAGRGLGKIKINSIQNTDTVLVDLGTFNLYQNIGESPVESGVKVYSGSTQNGGNISVIEPSVVYLGDEGASTPAKVEATASLPVVGVERIFNNNTLSSYGVGFKFELENISGSLFSGYVEIYFTIEDAS